MVISKEDYIAFLQGLEVEHIEVEMKMTLPPATTDHFVNTHPAYPSYGHYEREHANSTLEMALTIHINDGECVWIDEQKLLPLQRG